MNHHYEPLLRPVAVRELRPTQMTIGLLEVAQKREEWRRHADDEYLGRHMVPVVIGPGRRDFVIDHHHLLRALHDEGIPHILVSVIADLSHISKPAFWTLMENRNWLHPYDSDGKRRPVRDLPRSIGHLDDDPYRSLAGAVRRAGGYAKDSQPYSEFLWADFFRRRIGAKAVSRNFAKAVERAVKIAHSSDAGYLPGYCLPWIGAELNSSKEGSFP